MSTGINADLLHEESKGESELMNRIGRTIQPRGGQRRRVASVE